MQSCYNCKYARDIFVSMDETYMLYYCEKWHWMKLSQTTERCGFYEPNLHDNDAARTSPQTRDNGIHQEE